MAGPRLADILPHGHTRKFVVREVPGGLDPETAITVGLEALLHDGEYGMKAELAREYEVSPYVVDQCREDVREHLSTLYPSGLTCPIVEVKLDRRAVIRALVASRATVPLSIRGLKQLVTEFWGVTMGYTTLWDILSAYQEVASLWMDRQSLAGVKILALDELYFAGQWLLVAIDVETEYVCGLEVRDDRTESTWNELLLRLRKNQQLDPRVVVSDAGASILRSARAVFPSAQQQRDIFHAKRELTKVLHLLEQRAYSKLAHKYALEAEHKKTRNRSSSQSLRHARDEAERSVEKYEEVFVWTRQVFGALEFVDARTGRYVDGTEAEAVVAEIGEKFLMQKEKQLKKVGTYLKRQRGALCAYHGRLSAELVKLGNGIDEQAVVLMTACLYRIYRELGSAYHKKERAELLRLKAELAAVLSEITVEPPRVVELMVATQEAIRRSGRASSVVECFNGVLRKYLRIYKHLSVGPLKLVTVRWNEKERESGPLKGASPHSRLTGSEVGDWLTCLGLGATSGLPRPRRGYVSLGDGTGEHWQGPGAIQRAA